MTNFNPVPKPGNKKKKKKVNGWKHKAERMCYYCGTYGAERHEVYGGANRQNSIDFGFQVDLCPSCHMAWHDQKDPAWIRRKKEWQRYFQKLYEEKLIQSGMHHEQARFEWMSVIGKNYTDEVF